MTDQLLFGIAISVAALLIAYEAIETWRWRGFANRPPSRFRIVRLFRRALGGLVGIVTLRRFRRRAAVPMPTMSAYDLARRLGEATTTEPEPGPIHLQPGRITVSGSRVQPLQPVAQMVPVEYAPEPRVPGTSRARLVRDTLGAAIVMAGLVVVFVNALPAFKPDQGQVLGATATPHFTPIIVTAEPGTAPPVAIATATPEPSPTPTETPSLVSSTPSPTPTPTVKPTRPPEPTPAPTPQPTATPKPTPKPTPTPKPAAPTVTVTVDVNTIPADGGTVVFTISASHATHYDIAFDDTQFGQGQITSGAPFPVAHDYGPGAGPYQVVVTVTGPGGSDYATVTINVQ